MAWVEKRRNKWQGRYRDAAGKVRIAGASTSKREALALANDEESKLRNGTWHDPKAGEMTFSTYFEEHWLPQRVKNELTTIAAYRSHYNATLKDAFGATPVNKISSPQIQRWVMAQVKAGVRPGTVVAKYRTLATCLGGKKGVSAVRDGLIAESPCKGIDLPEVDKPEVLIYTPDEVDNLMLAFDAWWQPLLVFAAESGLRWGELLGIEVRDFEPGYEGVYVQRTIVELTIAETGNGTPFLRKPRPKSRKPRFVAIAPEISVLVDALVRERQLFPKDRLFSMPGKNGLPVRTDVWPEGLPVGRSYFRESLWKPAHKATDIEPRKFHALRGSHISWLLSGGADLVTVMDRVGHEHLSTTQAYVSRMPDSEQKALAALKRTQTDYRKAGNE